MTGTLVVEVTLRLTYAIGLIAALAFLGVTTNPNGADWGTMVQENSGRADPAALGLPAAGDRDRPPDRRHRARRRRARPRVERHRSRCLRWRPRRRCGSTRCDLGRGDGRRHRRPRDVRDRARRGARARRRVGLGQDDRRARGARAPSPRRAHRGRDDPRRRARRPLAVRRPTGATRADGSSRTCRRIPRSRSTPRGGSARSCSRRCACTTTAAATAARRARIAETMREVLLPDDDAFQRRYPHELSGGQQQRVAIAMAFACKPAVVVLDEPTTGLDVTTQAHILETIRRMTRAEGAAALYVTHDLAVVANLADRVAVMYAGLVVEQGPANEIFARAAHPYTRRLLAAIPRIDDARDLLGIPGRAPAPGQRPTGCPFVPRCELADPRVLGGRAAGRRGRRAPRGALPAGARMRSRASTPIGSPPRGRRAPASDALLEVRGVNASYGALAGRARRDASRSSEDSASRSWASRAAARRRSPARSQGCTASGRARSASTGRRSRPRRAGAGTICVAASSTSSRTRTGRSTRAAPSRRRSSGRSRCSTSRAGPRGVRVDEMLERVSLSSGARPPFPRRALGRRAPARRDRPRADLRARARGLRRGHERARRLRAGRDREPARRAAARPRPLAPVRDAQPAARALGGADGRRHAPGTDRRDRQLGARAARARRTSTRSACSPTRRRSRPRA